MPRNRHAEDGEVHLREGFTHRLRIGPPVLRGPREGSIDERHDRRRSVGHHGGERACRARCDRAEELERQLALEDELSRQEREHRCADPPHVDRGTRGVALAACLLRRHERRGAHRDAIERRACRRARKGKPSDSEVEQLHPPVGTQKDVLRFDVSVHHPCVVGRGEDVQQLVDDEQHFLHVQAAAAGLEPRVERRPLEELHDEERAPVLVDVVVEDVEGAFMLHQIGESPFAQEALRDPRVGAALRVHDFHRATAAVAMGRGVDGGHTAHIQQRVDVPLAAQSAADAPHHLRVHVVSHELKLVHRACRLGHPRGQYPSSEALALSNRWHFANC